jgi:CubicO group peptidase (beta-lactamase class C family)
VNAVNPEQVGCSAARLERVGSAMQRYVDEGKVAGMVAMAARYGQVMYAKCFGMMDIEAGKPMQFDTLFRIYSMTKPITSVAVLMLYEEGHLRLTDPVSRFIPEFEDLRVLVRETESGIELADLEQPVTIWHLLTHTSGLGYGWDESDLLNRMYHERLWPFFANQSGATLEELVQQVARLPLAHQPGSAWRYSVATDVLGHLVQVISGVPFDDFLKQRILAPLGMVDTGFHVPETKIARFAANYGLAENGGLELIDAPATSQYARPTRAPLGGVGLVSTATDYMRFAQMLLNKGELDGVRLLGRKTVELMTTSHCKPLGDLLFEDHSGFGLGFMVLEDVAKSRRLGSAGTYSWAGSATTYFWVDPQEQLIGLLMLQFLPIGTYPVHLDFQVAVYQSIVD